MKTFLFALSCLILHSFIHGQTISLVNEQNQGSCDGAAYLDEGSINAQYGYTWWETDTTNNLISTVGSNPTDSLINLCPGNYALEYHDSLYNISNTDTLYYYFTIDSASSCTINLSTSATNESSAGACDGSITSTVTGAMGAVTYSWSTGGTTSDLNNVCAGTYELTVTDTAACSTSSIVVVSTDSSSSNNLIATIWTSDETADGSCDGSVVVSPSGGTAPYSYQHSNGTSAPVDSSLCDGIYDVLITDNAGDSLIMTYMIASPSFTYNDTSYADSTIVDTLSSQPLEDCNIDYSTIDSAYVDDVHNIGNDSVLVDWIVIDANGAYQVSNTYYLPSLNTGVYAFELSIFCPQKTGGSLFKFNVKYFVDEQELNTDFYKLQRSIALYPNPSNGIFNVDIENADSQEYKVLDSRGSQVAKGTVKNNSFVLDLTFADSGMYFLYIQGQQPVRLIIE